MRLPHRAAKGSTSPGAYTPVTLTCHLCPLLPPDASLSRPPAHSASRPSSQRLTAGIIHGIRLGSATVLRTFNGRPYIGTVSSFRHPWFKISYTDGDAEDLDGDQLAAHIIYSNDDFYDQSRFFYDFSVVHPARIPQWRSAMSDFCSMNGLRLPSPWLQGAVALRRGISPSAFQCASELTALQTQLDRYIASSRAPRTWRNLRNPGLRVLWFFATRRVPLPPSAEEAALLLTYFATTRDNTGAVSTALNALTALCELNGWRSDIYHARLTLAPVDAMRRLHRTQTKKSEGLRTTHVASILDAYVFKPIVATWPLAIGTAIGIGFKLLLRYDDLRRCRWDDGYCDIFPLHIRFYLDGRKNNQYRGNMLDIAIPLDPKIRGVYHACLIAKRTFKKGYVLPSISACGSVDSTRYMQYSDFVRFLRSALKHIGLSDGEARRYAGQSMRSGGATAAAMSGLSPAEICHLAGVKDVDWLSYYNRNHLSSRLRASRAVGL